MDTSFDVLRIPESVPHGGFESLSQPPRPSNAAQTLSAGHITQWMDEMACLTLERDELREQVQVLTEFADRLIDASEAKDEQIALMTKRLMAFEECVTTMEDRLIEFETLSADLETENELLIRQVSACQDRVEILKSFIGS